MVPRKIITILFLFAYAFGFGQTNNEVKEISKTAITNGTGIQIVSGQISVVDNQSEQKVRIYKAGSIGGIRRSINFIEGSNVTITPVDNSGSDRIDVTIALTGVQASLVSGTNIKTINGASILGSGDIVAGGLDDDPDFKAYAALGSPFLAQTVGSPIQLANTSSALTDAQIRFQAVYLAKAATITGVRVYSRTAGVYTGDANNKVGLYSYSGGTLTLVASSTNSASLWTGTANAFQTIAFSATYSASAGIYFVALLYNNSAQTTAPSIASGTALNNAAMATLAFTNSAKLYGTLATQTDLPASQAMSGITAATTTTWVALY